MVLENCEPCMNYWIENGRNMYGYKLLINDQHIPEAHTTTTTATTPDTTTVPVIDSSDHEQNKQCEICVAYWLKKGRCILPGQHIPEAHSSSTPTPESGGRNEESLPKKNDKKQTTEIDASWHFPLYKAALVGDWESGKPIFLRHGSEALRAKIKGYSETALHVAVGSGPVTINFVSELLQLLLPKDLEEKTSDGCTPLGIAAKVGNLEAAKLLVGKHPILVYIPDASGSLPIHTAAEYGQKDMLFYMLQVTEKGQNIDPYDPEGRGPELLRFIIKAEFYEAALHLLQVMPKLATSGMTSNQSLLILAQNPSAFSCWRSGGVFKSLAVACVPALPKNQANLRITRDIENAIDEEQDLSEEPRTGCCGQRYLLLWLQIAYHFLWTLLEKMVPILKRIKSEKHKGCHARKLVECLSREAANNLKKSSDEALLFKIPLLLAAENGIHEIVKEITYSFPDTIWYHDNNNSEVFRLAIKNRHHEVYNLLYEMGDLYTNIVRQSVDENDDNILHLAGYLASSDRLRDVSGAALQMQRELQWFQEIEGLVQPAYKSKKNVQGKTPQEVFTESHQKLMEDGEKWMRDTANSCTVAAALIATVVFAAAITVPGGNNQDNGKPMFGSQQAFIIFGVADAISLFTSCVSILMFLSILTSRYAEGDFLKALPTRLLIGLFTLFISVGSMMAAFSSILYLMFGHARGWILGCVIAPSCLLVAVFAVVQFSLLADIFTSTYRRKLFKRRSKKKSFNGSTNWLRSDKKRN